MGDESFYATALHEYDSGAADVALRAKAYVAADGIEDRIKIEYIKLRVAQLKGGQEWSLSNWYGNTSLNERTAYFILSIILIAAYGIGLIALVVLLWLNAGENDARARKANQSGTSANQR